MFGAKNTFAPGLIQWISWPAGMGSIRKKDGLYRDIPDGSFMYFVHSYYVDPADKNIVSAETDYGFPFAASVEEGNIAGMQFHPEKSGDAGLAVLRRFAFPEGRRVC